MMRIVIAAGLLASAFCTSTSTLSFQAVLSESEVRADLSVFSFQPPVNGCYMVEEQHPEIPGESDQTLAVNYCRGQRVEGTLNHTDGRHNQWNYVTSLPFFVGLEGSMELEQSLVERAAQYAGDHRFRVTHLGQRCSAPEAEVLRASIQIAGVSARRLSAAPSNAEMKSNLAAVLAATAQVSPARLSVTHLSSASPPMVAEVTVLPAGVPTGASADEPHPTAAEAFGRIRAALNGDSTLIPEHSPCAARQAPCGARQDLCGSAGLLPADGCSVTLVEDAYRVPSQMRSVAPVDGDSSPRVSRSTPQNEEESKSNDCLALYVVGLAVLALGVPLSFVACYKGYAKRHSGKDRVKTSEGDVEAGNRDETAAEGKPTAQKPTMDAVVVTAPVKPGRSNSVLSDTASTATPTEEEANMNDVASVHSGSTGAEAPAAAA
jgi:hypothetical protein